MGKPRAKPAPPPPPAVEPTEAPPPADGEPEAEPEADDRGVFPDEDIPAARIDEKVELPSPAAGAAGGPRMPDPPPMDNFIHPPGGMPSPQEQAPYEPQQQQIGGADYGSGQGQDEPPEQPRRDDDPAREAARANAGRETDMLCNVFVDYEDDEHGGEMVSCGMLARVTMTRAYMPESYIPTWVGGNTFWYRVYYATGNPNQIGRPLGNGAAVKYAANTGKPFVRGWKVNMDIDQMLNQKLAAAGIAVPQTVVPGQAPGTLPIAYAQGQVGYFQQELADTKRRLDLAEERARRAEERAERDRELQPIKDQMARIEQKLNGGNGAGHSDEMVKLVASVLNDRGSKEDKAEERRLRLYEMQHGPQATAMNFQMMNSVAELSMKMLQQSAKKDGIDVNAISDKFLAFQTMQTTQRREDLKFKEELIDRREERADRRKERERQLADNDKRIGRSIDAMYEGLVNAIRDREPPEKVAGMFNILKESAIEFHWTDFDKSMTELLHDLTTFPEVPIAGAFAPKAGIVPPVSDKDGSYLLEIGKHLRATYKLGPFDPVLYKQRIAAMQQPQQPAQATTPAKAQAAAAPPVPGAGQAAAPTPSASSAPAAKAEATATSGSTPSPAAAPAPAPEAKS